MNDFHFKDSVYIEIKIKKTKKEAGRNIKIEKKSKKKKEE